MKALILAAGYGTRLYPLTESMPKPLLDVRDKPMVEYVLEKIEPISNIEDIYLVVNDKFYRKFEEWKRTYHSERPIKLMNDGTTDDSNKLGAVKDIGLVIGKEKVDSELLIVAGDNLFNFALDEFYNFWQQKKSFCIGLIRIDDSSLVCQYSSVKLDEEKRITDFVEKPSKPLSNLIAICVYIFPKEGLYLVKKYLEDGNNPDAPGYFMQWLVKREKVYGYEFNGNWFDIGDIDSYKKANKEFH